MKSKTVTSNFWQGTLAFIFPAVVSCVLYLLTLAPGLGPATAAGWAASAVGSGDLSQSIYSPFFRLIVKFVALLGSSESIPANLNVITAVGAMMTSGAAGVIFFALFKRWQIWGATTLATFGGVLIALARLHWAAALMVNPATWSAAFLALSLASTTFIQLPAGKEARFRLTLAGLFLGLSIATFAGAVFFVPAAMSLMQQRARSAGQTPVRSLIAFFIPFLFFLAPLSSFRWEFEPLFTTPQGITTNLHGIAFASYNALFALTPIAAAFALWGIVSYVKRERGNSVFLLLLFIGCIAGAFVPQFYEFIGLISVLLIVFLAAIGMIDLANRLPMGLSFGVWILVPFAILFSYQAVDRSDESIWREHLDNTIKTARYQSNIFATDNKILAAPYAFLRKAEDFRPDIVFINPNDLSNASYIEFFKREYDAQIPEDVSAKLDSLAKLVNNGSEAFESYRSSLLSDWIASEIAIFDSSDTGVHGVLTSPDFIPSNDHKLIPEGLFIRHYKGETQYPFLFRLLDLSHIKYRKSSSKLEQIVVSNYPMMFTARGSWLLEKEFFKEGSDYIRWALRVDPDYVPAQLIANRYSIYGEPKILFPK